MAEGVVTIVTEGIKPLGEFIIQQAKFLSGVGYQIDLAQIELHLIRGFLKDADTRQQDEELVRICVKLIRDAAYDLEDVIESVALKVAIRSRGGNVKTVLKRFACIFNEGVHRYKIGSEIEDIMAKLSHLRSSLQSYNIRQTSGSENVASAFKRQRDRRLTYGHEVESHIVGLKENTDKLVKELVREGKRHLVVSIWGMGGSGKTTLAKQVFHQDEVKRHFDCFAWLCISQQWDGKKVLEEILIKLTSPTTEKRKEISKMAKDEIAEEACSVQRVKRCLVVLDDIWSLEAWNSIKAGFPINEGTESRVLLTTRKKEVASLASGADYLHQPRPLDENQSWELFEKIAISGRDETDSVSNANKRELGKKMLGHCSGLPLAISVLSGLLSKRDKVEEWEAVLRNVNKYIMRGTNVVEREISGQENGVSGVLALSYDDLPSQLKLCFLYLAQYPEDHEIPVKRLIQLWIAEGFITSTSEIYGSLEKMEDVAYGCLIELVERSMIQVVKYGISGKVKSCHLHDLMRDLCLQKSKEESFLEVVNFSSGVANTRLFGKVRRLAVYLDDEDEYKFDSRDARDSRIRSLLYFNTHFNYQIRDKKVMRSICSDFRWLRVLKLERIRSGSSLPKTIGNLVLLRFLSLKDSAFGDELPSSLSNLVLLQTLDLRRAYFKPQDLYGNMTKIFWNMENLRHLYFPKNQFENNSSQKLPLGRLHNLQTLVSISLDGCDLNGFVQLTNLRKLRIFAARSGHLEELKNLLISRSVKYEHLWSLSVIAHQHGGDIPGEIVLRCPHLYKLDLKGKLTELPVELPSYPNLTKIKLRETELKGDQIEILEKLPKLKVLRLWGRSTVSGTLVFSQGGFPQLQVLDLRFLDRLTEWTVERGAMPCLQRLEMEGCEELQAVPDELQNITTLKELSFIRMGIGFSKRIEEGGEDIYKIKHVPSLIIKPDWV